VIATHDFTGGDASTASGTARTSRDHRRPACRTPRRASIAYASGAYLLNLRVLGDDGSGMASHVIEAIDWTIEHRENSRSASSTCRSRAGAAAES